jgi:hypothetical protein
VARYLSPQDVHEPLEVTSERFHSTFPPLARFRACCALVILLRDFLLTPPQRLTVYFLLFDVYRRHPSGVNPFVPVFVDAASPASGVANHERLFSQKLLLSAPTDRSVASKSSHDHMEVLSAPSSSHKSPDLSDFLKTYATTVPAVPALRQVEAGGIIIDAAGTEAKARAKRAVVQAMLSDGGRSRADAGGDLHSLTARGGAIAQSVEAAASSPEEPLTISTLPQPQLTSFKATLRLPVLPGAIARADGTEFGARSALRVASALNSVMQAKAEHFPPTPQSLILDPASQLRGGVARIPPALVAAAMADPAEPSTMEQFALSGCQPVFARPPPPLVDIAPGELTWLDPIEPPTLLWDAYMGIDMDSLRRARTIITKALRGTLDNPEVEEIRRLLMEAPEVVFDAGLSPADLAKLVEHNPSVAVDCLIALRDTSQIQE